MQIGLQGVFHKTTNACQRSKMTVTLEVNTSTEKGATGPLTTTASQDLSLPSHPKDRTFYSAVPPSLCGGAGLSFQQQPNFPQRSPIQALTDPCLASAVWHEKAAGRYGVLFRSQLVWMRQRTPAAGLLHKHCLSCCFFSHPPRHMVKRQVMTTIS